MRFIETPIFTQVDLLDDEAYWLLQSTLLIRPRLGPGGLRKVRWSAKGVGKRGGIRVIYFWYEPSETFYMLFAYRKNQQEELTKRQLRTLSRLVREEFG